MQEGPYQRLRAQPPIDVEPEPAVGTGEERGDGSGRGDSQPGVARRPGPVRVIHPEHRTEVPVGALTVTGVLPGSGRPPVGSIAVGGDVHRLSCDEALELADALMLVVTRMDVVAEERYRPHVDAGGGPVAQRSADVERD